MLFHAILEVTWVILLGVTPPPGLFWKADVWLMDIVYKTKADIPVLSPE